MRLALPLAASLITLTLTAASPPQAVDPARLMADTKELASPAYEGRGPGTAGEDKTVAFLIERFKLLGLKPGPGGSFVQEVPLVHTRLGEGTVTIGGAEAMRGRDLNLTTVRPADRLAIKSAPLVFVRPS